MASCSSERVSSSDQSGIEYQRVLLDFARRVTCALNMLLDTLRSGQLDDGSQCSGVLSCMQGHHLSCLSYR